MTTVLADCPTCTDVIYLDVDKITLLGDLRVHYRCSVCDTAIVRQVNGETYLILMRHGAQDVSPFSLPRLHAATLRDTANVVAHLRDLLALEVADTPADMGFVS